MQAPVVASMAGVVGGQPESCLQFSPLSWAYQAGSPALDICCKICKICTKSKNFKGQEATERERALSDDRRAEIRINICLGNLGGGVVVEAKVVGLGV
jgi:hypothetical protein